MVRTDTETTPIARTATDRAAGIARAAVAYALFGLGIAALVSFFAPYVGLSDLAWHTTVLPEIAAPTEGDRVVDVAPLIVGVVTASVGVWVR